MNGGEIDRIEQVFTAKIEPLVKSNAKLVEAVGEHSQSIASLETKFENVGNCEEHAAQVRAFDKVVENIPTVIDDKVEPVKEKADANGVHIWGLVVLLLTLAAGLIYSLVT